MNLGMSHTQYESRGDNYSNGARTEGQTRREEMSKSIEI